jgi:hypothetical protein
MKILTNSFNVGNKNTKSLLIGLIFINTISLTALLKEEGVSSINRISLGSEERQLADKEIIGLIAGSLQQGTSKVFATMTECSDPNEKKKKEPGQDQNSKESKITCPLKINSFDFTVTIKYTNYNSESGELFINVSGIPKTSLHEFSLKFISKMTEIKDGKAILLEGEMSNIKNKFNENLEKIWQGTKIIDFTRLAKEISDTIIKSPDFGNKLDSLEGLQCSSKVCRLYSIVSFIEKKWNFEIRIVQLGSLSLLRLNIQLGNKRMSIKIPTIGSEDDFKKIKDDIQANFKSWLSTIETEDCFIQKREALTVVQDTVTKTASCYQIMDTNSDQDKKNYFTLNLKLKGEDKECKGDGKKKFVSETIKIVYIHYPFGVFNYGQLVLDSDIQTSEYLLDQKEDNFTRSITEEINDFMASTSILFDESKQSQDLSLTEIVNFIKSKSKFTCNSFKPTDTEIKFTKEKETVITVTYLDGQNKMFKIKFTYPKKYEAQAMTKNKAISRTNNIIIQKFNSYSQLSRIEKALLSFEETIKL